jgi:hypothetical protein
VHALGRRDVDLDPVAEPEQALDARALPDQRVEGADERGGAGQPRALRLRVEVGGLAPALDGDGQQLARLGELGDAGARLGDREPVVVAKVALGRDAERAPRSG